MNNIFNITAPNITAQVEMPAIPVPQVDSAGVQTPVAAMPHTGDVSMIGLFLEADITVQIVMAMLLLASFWSWSIIINKWLLLRGMRRKMDLFEHEIWQQSEFEAYFHKIRHNAKDPAAKVFVAGMEEWVQMKEEGRLLTPLDDPQKEHQRREHISSRMFRAMDIARNREMNLLERNIGFLATVGSTAPFVGLFGTVWGIMNSFQSIALSKNTSLAVVAPGIAEALFATAIGLFAAIPAVVFYNKLNNDIAGISERVDMFSDEFSAVVAKGLYQP